MARNDAAAGRPVAEVPKAASEPKSAPEPKASPEGKASSEVIASENVTGADDGPGLVAAAGGRLSAVTAHGPRVVSQAPTPTSPAGDPVPIVLKRLPHLLLGLKCEWYLG